MVEESTAAKKSVSRRLVWIIVAALILVTIVLVATPHAIRWYLQEWLADNGAVEIEIGDVDFNPFLGRARVESLHFTSDGASQGADQIVLRMTWRDLLARQVMFERIVVRNARISVRRTETNRLFLAAVAVGGAEAVGAAQEVEEASGWGVGLAGVELENVSVHYVDPLLDYNVSIPAFSIDRMTTWEPDRDTRLSGRIEIGDTFFRLDGKFRPFAKNFLMQAQAGAGNVPLAAFHRAFPEWGLDSLAGRINLDGGLDLSERQNGEFLIVYDGSLSGTQTRVEVGGSGLAIDTVDWNGRAEVNLLTDGLEVVTGGEIRLDSVAGNLGAEQLAGGADAISWAGDADIRSGDARLGIELAGTLSAKLAQLDSGSPDASGTEALRAALDQFEFVAQSFSLDAAEGAVEVAHSGSLLANGIETQTGAARVGLDTVDWKGDSGFRQAGDESVVSAAGDLGLSSLAVEDQGGVSAGLQSATWTGEAQARSGSDWQFDVDGSAGLDVLEIAKNGIGLLRVAGASTTFERSSAAGMVGLRPLRIDSVGILRRPGQPDEKEPAHVVEVQSINVSSLSAGRDRLDIGDVGIDGMRAWLAIAPEGRLELRDLLATVSESPAREKPGRGESSGSTDGRSGPGGFRYSIASIATVNPLTIDYRDDTVKPKVRLSFTPMELTVGRIDSADPASDTRIKLTTGLGRYGKLGYDGTLRPLAEKLTAVGTGTVDALDLTAFDGYARRNNGYRVDSGTLSADVKVDIRDDEVDSLARFVIRELDVARIVPEEDDELGQELGVPLDVAFSLLKDKQDNIRLDVPLEGDLSELSADFGHALRIVLNKGVMLGVRTAATTFFAPLWPVLAAEKVVGAMSKLQFKAVKFTPGTPDMTTDSAAYVDELARLVGQRPEFSLKICGRSVAKDRSVLYPDAAAQPLSEEQLSALEELAVERQLRVKDALIERGIEAARVVTCAPDPARDDQGAPRVDVGI